MMIGMESQYSCGSNRLRGEFVLPVHPDVDFSEWPVLRGPCQCKKVLFIFIDILVDIFIILCYLKPEMNDFVDFGLDEHRWPGHIRQGKNHVNPVAIPVKTKTSTTMLYFPSIGGNHPPRFTTHISRELVTIPFFPPGGGCWISPITGTGPHLFLLYHRTTAPVRCAAVLC